MAQLNEESEIAPVGEYQQILRLVNQPIVSNTEPSKCNLCSKMTTSDEGIILINCLHSYCKTCLQNSLRHATTVRCPFPDGRYQCDGMLSDHEIEALLGSCDYEILYNRVFEAIQQDEQVKSPNPSIPKDLDLLITLTDASIVPNPEKFDCPICFDSFEAYEGIILRECFHSFCRACLSNSIKFAEDVVVRCPFPVNDGTCDQIIEDREVKCLLNDDDYKIYLGRSLKKAETMAENAFHCKTPDCDGWCLVEDAVSLFQCPVCFADNCLRCKAIHPGIDCEEYQDRMSGDYENRKSERTMLKLVSDGQAMRCPSCGIVITKKGGCDNMKCAMCNNSFRWTAG
ncbi:ranBP-type and C3HC4-type zinc finger-containing protein 1-like [Topomyia yanbarensis]|uniref:ranBP-type and C3HC4-type zinc finger-containing protein 1-like n=1 Tax=Topomyia yanbarensis TaxID=2498891 RepID=UPI00273ADCDE|nr:ranBP-type and C3HC4-type zinc finger-containing protein 1-like [Topomyia yanbarensis]